MGNKHYDHLIIMRPSVMNAVYVNNARHKIYWTHNDYYLNYAGKNLSLKKRISKWVRRFTYRKFNMIWTVSETICEEMGRCFSLNNIHALPNPLNCTQIRKKSLEPCNLEMNSTKNNFIMIGRMSREKGFHRILRFMCTEALHKYPDGHLYVIGNDTNSDRLRKSVEQQGLTGRVHLLGPQANPYPYLRQAQFLICPSLSESFGLAMLEAMLLRVRVITTDTVGGKYITQNGKLARCVPNNDTALCNAVSEYLEDMSCYQYSLEDAEKWAEHHDIGLFGVRLMELLKNE